MNRDNYGYMCTACKHNYSSNVADTVRRYGFNHSITTDHAIIFYYPNNKVGS